MLAIMKTKSILVTTKLTDDEDEVGGGEDLMSAA